MKISRKIRRDLCAVVALCLILSCVGITAFTASSDCTENCAGSYENGICSVDSTHYEAAPVDNGVYQISNAGQLYWFAALVNGGENEYEGDNGDVYNAVLTADIVVDDEAQVNWTPIGLYTSAREYVRYSGTFDGNGHTISGLYYHNQTYTGRTVGLFGCLDSNGTVKNVNVADSYFCGSTDVAGVVSHNYGGTVIGCSNAATVSGTGKTGGIVSRNMDGGSVINCTNTGAVSGAGTGGIVGENEKDSKVENCNNTGAVSGTSSVGGIVGANRGTVKGSSNSGAVTASGTHVGGVVGNHMAGTISTSGNSGAVSGASDYIGGVAGLCAGSVISNSYNTGSVTGDEEKSDGVGGVAGVVNGNYTASSTVTGCYNTGAVTGRGWVDAVVGNLGYQNTTNTATVENCYYQADSETDSLNGTTAMAAAKFASGEAAYIMNGSTSTGDDLVWYQNIDITATTPDASPVPDDTHGVVYYGPDCSATMGYTNFEPVNGENGPHKDVNGDHKCDVCGAEASECADANKDHNCDICGEVLSECADENEDNKCDICGKDMGGTEPSEPDESKPTVPSDPTGPSEPEPSKPQVPECEKDDNCVLADFSDIKIDDWYHDGVHFCVEEGIMNGMGDGTFAPNEATTRAQLVIMLYRLEGEPSIEGMSEPFTDVAETDWFYEPIVWAYNTKVVNGMTETTFEPNTNVSREQVATILYRYLGSPEGSGKLDAYPDVDKVQDYAKDALIWAVGEGLINGVKQADGTSLLDPAGNATRAQIATILMRYLTGE